MITCIAPGLTVTGIVGARTFAIGEQIDPDAVVATRAGGVAETWRDVLGGHLVTHFTAEAKPAHESIRSATQGDTGD